MKKKILAFIMSAVMVFMYIPFMKSITVFAGVDDYPAKYKNAAVDALVDEWHYYNRECTSFVAWRLNSRNGIAFHNMYGGVNFGNAGTWGNAARSIGITVDMNPAVGSVYWVNNGGYGHVAWVEEVNGDNVTIEEYNWLISSDPYLTDGAYHRQTVNKNKASGYIHFKDIKPEPPKPSKATLTVTAGNTETPTKFTWNACTLAEVYDLRIYKASERKDEVVFKKEFGIKGLSYSCQLPEGDYIANLASTNYTNSNWTFSDDVAFSVTKPLPEKATLTIIPGTSKTETKFSWNICKLAEVYDLRIYKASERKDEVVYLKEFGIKGLSYSCQLPEGDYIANLASTNYTNNNWTFGDDVKFSVKLHYQSPFSGKGTDESPYLITSKEELELFRDLINSEFYAQFYTCSYKLTNDIDLKSEPWIPIGKRFINGQNTSCCFAGHFDGGYHTIKGLNVNETTKFAGLFGSTYGGVGVGYKDPVIENLVVEGTVTNTHMSTGGIVGEICSGGILRNCCFIGNVSGKYGAVGGICGVIWQYGTIENCYHIGKVVCSDKNTDIWYESSAGGIIGDISVGERKGTIEVKNCYHAGAITGVAGSIVGSTAIGGTASVCINIENCYALKDDGAICGNGKADKLDVTQLNPEMLKKSAEFLGENYAYNPDSTFINGYPVFKWQSKSNLIGDANNDFEVNVSDIVMLQKYITKKDTVINNVNADINGDGKINVFDGILLRRLILKK